ncbi:SDR family oxidoreductase [Neisseriaceae bacterium TC5R-5]|nr:SDR family oxidoreductase [Neisseriaceae bacterium TC5R-5]
MIKDNNNLTDVFSLNGKRVAIIGASGMLGQMLYRVAKQRAIAVIRLARHQADYNIDATDFPQLLIVLQRISPDIIINAAAQTNLNQCEQHPQAADLLNGQLVAVLANYCRANAVKLVQISTDHYFSGDKQALHSEDHPILLLNQYAKSKYVGELAAATAPQSLIVRTNIVGFRGWPNQPTFIEWAIASFRQKTPITLFDDFYTSSIDVLKFSETLYDLIDKNVVGLINIAAAEVVSKADFLLRLAYQLNMLPIHYKTGSVHALSEVKRAESLGLDTRLVEKILGYSMPDTDAVIRNLVAVYKEGKHAI